MVEFDYQQDIDDEDVEIIDDQLDRAIEIMRRKL
jgi:hypothetical protein